MSALLDHRSAPVTGIGLRFGALVAITDGPQRREVVDRLATLGGHPVVEAASVAEARVRARAFAQRDLVVADVKLPDGSGAGLVAELLRGGWHRAIALSSELDPFSVRAVLAAGARGLVIRPGRDERPRAATGNVADLSNRELEVLQLVAGGHTNKDIGELLGLSALTVKSHLARIGRKMGTGDRAELVMIALRAGAIE